MLKKITILAMAFTATACEKSPEAVPTPVPASSSPVGPRAVPCLEADPFNNEDRVQRLLPKNVHLEPCDEQEP